MSILVSPAEFARRHDLHKTTISRLCRRGFFDSAIVRVPGKKRYFLDQTKADLLLAENRDPNFVKGGINTKALSGSPAGKTFFELRTASELYKAKNRQLAYETKKDKYVRRSQVKREVAAASKILTAVFAPLPARIVKMLKQIDQIDEHTVLRILHQQHEQSLKEFVRLVKNIKVEGDNEKTFDDPGSL